MESNNAIPRPKELDKCQTVSDMLICYSAMPGIIVLHVTFMELILQAVHASYMYYNVYSYIYALDIYTETYSYVSLLDKY